MKVAVVGQGFWGTATALALLSRGVEVDVYDNGHARSASRAAAGIVQESWYKRGTRTSLRLPAWWTHEHFAAGWALLEESGLKQTGEWFATRTNPTWRYRKDMWLLEHPAFLLRRVHAEPWAINKVVPEVGRVWIHASAEDPRAYDHVVVAAGAWCDDLLIRSGLPTTGVQTLPGRAFYVDRAPPNGEPRTWLGSPYRHLTWRPWPIYGGRIGDTVERTDRSVTVWRDRIDEARQAVDPLGVLVSSVQGFRPVTRMIVADSVHARVHVATGGHRVGLLLAGGVAHKLATDICGRTHA